MVKKVASWALIAVVVMWLVKDPSGAAQLAHQAIGALSHAASALTSFTGSVGGG